MMLLLLYFCKRFTQTVLQLWLADALNQTRRIS